MSYEVMKKNKKYRHEIYKSVTVFLPLGVLAKSFPLWFSFDHKHIIMKIKKIFHPYRRFFLRCVEWNIVTNWESGWDCLKVGTYTAANCFDRSVFAAVSQIRTNCSGLCDQINKSVLPNTYESFQLFFLSLFFDKIVLGLIHLNKMSGSKAGAAGAFIMLFPVTMQSN